MSYPIPIPPLEGEAARAFERELDAFTISDDQRERVEALRAKVRERQAVSSSASVGSSG